MVGFAHDSEGTTNPHPADAVTIPADARGAFHLPPAASKPSRFVTTGLVIFHRNNRPFHRARFSPDDIPRNVVARRAANPLRNRELFPRGGTADCLSISSDRHLIRQLTSGGKITGNVLVDGRVMEEVGTAVLGI